MDCGHCRTENPASFRHCGACGQRLAATPCDSCGFSTPVPFSFCGNCGNALDLQRGGPSEERRFASVVFADVVGFTTLADDTDPEDVARVIDAAFRQLSDVVTAHGGTIDKYIGDSLMAVFGLTQAHEDDAERAVAAALAMQRCETGLGFAIGVNTGEVMATALGGGAVTVMGDPVNVAARLEKAAKEGEVLVGPITYELTAHRINYRERPPMTLKGKRFPVEVHQALSIRSRAGAPAAQSVPMIGRVEELDFLFSQWKRAATLRRLSTVLLTGDAGIGKTRLLDELVERIGDDALVIRSTYPPYGGAGGVRVGGDLLAQLGPSFDDAIDRRVRSLGGDVDPSLAEFDPTALRKEQLWALRRLAEDRAAERPILVVIEDVHMASTSIDLLTSFIAQVSDLPMLVVLAGRPEGRWLSSFPMASTVRLRSLTLEGSKALARLWQPETEPDPALLAWAGGNPLFLRELLAFATVQGVESVERQQWPVSLRAVLAARLDTFAPVERAALQDFAVIGDTATVEQLLALGGPGLSEGISGLTNAGVIRHRPDGTLRITEPLLREVAYEMMPRVLRVERHCRMVELSTDLDDRARHLSRASEQAPDDAALRVRAADALAAAGLEALNRSRRPEGVASLRKAIEFGHRTPATILALAEVLNGSDPTESLRLLTLFPEPSGDERIDAERLLVRGNALMDNENAASLVVFGEAIERWASIGDRVKLAWAHSNRGVALFMAGRMADSDNDLVAAGELFRNESNRAGELSTVSFRALVRPDHPDVQTWLQDSLAYAVEVGDRSRHVASLISLQWHSYLTTRLGGPDETAEARGWIDELLTLTRKLGWHESTFQALCLQANLARNDGDVVTARASVDAAREVSVSGSAGERALLAAIEASLDPGRPFRRFDDSDPFTSLAGTIQMETALFENRFQEIIDQDLLTRRENLTHHQAVVGFVSAAAGLACCGQLEQAEELASRGLAMAGRSGQTLPTVAASAIVAECRVRRGLPHEPVTSAVGGLAGALVARAQAWAGDLEAADRLAEIAVRLRAPGLDADIRSARVA
jgi:class 3 adenylate cyclase